MHIKVKLYCIIFSVALITFQASAKAPLKKTLHSLYRLHPVTFLNETPFNEKGIAQTRLCDQCPIESRIIQFIPVIPVQAYLSHKMCYTEKLCIDKKGNRFKGIRCCYQKEPGLKAFEQDLHHLVPDFPIFSKLIHGPLQKTPERLKGEISRMFLYLSLKYHFVLPLQNRIEYERWNRQYPPQAWEIQRNELIKQYQGDGNSYIQR